MLEPITVMEETKDETTRKGPPKDGPAQRKGETKQQILDRHRKEIKEHNRETEALIAKCKDKPARKKVLNKMKTVGDQIRARHRKELAALASTAAQESREIAADSVEGASDNCSDPTLQAYTKLLSSTPTFQKNTPSRAQKRKNRKQLRRQQLEEEIDRERAGAKDLRAEEMRALISKLSHMKVHEISADGDCLYNAIAHQMLSRYSTNFSAGEFRRMASSYMAEHKDEFLPFYLADDNNSNDFDDYLQKIIHTKIWGGQLELTAISNCLLARIKVYSAESPDIVIQPSSNPAQYELHLSYHKQYYSLGEHYNSVIEEPFDD